MVVDGGWVGDAKSIFVAKDKWVPGFECSKLPSGCLFPTASMGFWNNYLLVPFPRSQFDFIHSPHNVWDLVCGWKLP